MQAEARGLDIGASIIAYTAFWVPYDGLQNPVLIIKAPNSIRLAEATGLRVCSVSGLKVRV